MRPGPVLVVGVALLLAACSAAPQSGDALEVAVATKPPEEPSTANGPDTAAAPSATAAAPTTQAPDLSAVKRFRSARDHQGVAAPVVVRIPAIGVSSTLERLGRAADKTVEVPTEWARAGWYAGGYKPGERGPAVILGHVDSRAGPAVFFRLHELQPGDEVLVERHDGSVARFAVSRIEQYDKDRFPTDEVYFPALEPTLRLVTCGGDFDSSVRHYTDNIIVFASAASHGSTHPHG